MSGAPEHPDPAVLAALRADLAARPVEAELDAQTEHAIWRAVSGEVSAEERSALLARARAEPAVAEAWRLAKAMQDELLAEAAPEPAVVRGPASWFRRPAVLGGLVAVAVAAAAVFALRVGPDPAEAPPMRAVEDGIRSALDPADPLPREAAELAWSGAAEGSRFSVVVTTADLQPVAAVGGLAEARWTVPAEQLAPLPTGTVLLWRVESQGEDGTRVASPTFQATLR